MDSEGDFYIPVISPAVHPPLQGGQGAWPAATGGACRQETGRFFSVQKVMAQIPIILFMLHVNCNGFKTLKYFFQAIPKRKVTEENKADGKHKTCKSSDGMP